MRVLKYYIPEPSLFENCKSRVVMPRNAKILSCAIQDNQMVVWALIPDDLPPTTDIRHFVVVNTGTRFQGTVDSYNFVGTMTIDGIVWHLFEISND